MVVAPGAMPGPDHQQPGVLPLGPGIGLQGHRRKTGERCEPGLQLLGQPLVAGGLSRRSEGMQPSEGGPAHGQQLSGCIELHGATPEGDHPVHQGKISTHQALDVAHQFGLTAMVVKHRLAEPGVNPLGHTAQLLNGRQR